MTRFSRRRILMKLQTLTNKRGNILLFTVILILPLMLVFAGLVSDLAYFGDIDNELQRAMDSAALAGAGKLGFDNSKFPAAFSEAQKFASLNPYRGVVGSIGTLAQSTSDNTDVTCPGPAGGTPPDWTGHGKIVLGIWDPAARTFQASDDGNRVNAVKTQFCTRTATSFVRFLGEGFKSFEAFAQAIAWTPPPTVPASCTFPIALTWDPLNFPPPGGGGGGGIPPGNWLCGKPASFSTSSTNNNLNTAGWANLTGCGTPSANTTRDAVNAAGDPNCPIASL